MNVDKPVDKKVVNFLRHLNFSTDEIDAYLYLLAHGPQTVLALSRGIKTGRTKLYPLLDKLADKQLVTVHERHYGTTYQASSPAALEFLVAEAEQATNQLRSQLPGTLQLLNQVEQASPVSSYITEYTGLDGLKQLYWQTSQYAGERQVIAHPAIRKVLGAAFLAKHPLQTTNTAAKLDQEVHVYGSTVAILNASGGVAIQNKELADNYRQLLSLLV